MSYKILTILMACTCFVFAVENVPDKNTVVEPAIGNVVAYWSFDSDSSDTYTDITGNKHDAVTTGVGVAEGITGTALDCTDSTFDITVNNSVEDFNVAHFTIEGWIYPYGSMVNPGSFYNYQSIFENIRCGIEGSQDGGGFALQITDMGKLRLSMARPVPVGSETWVYITAENYTFQPRKWYHVVGTYDGATMKMYINGKLVEELPYTLDYRPSDIPTRIACEHMLNGLIRNRFIGKIDELKLYDYALDSLSIAQHYNLLMPKSPDTLVAYWSFDSDSATNYSDETGNGYDALASKAGVIDGVSGTALNCADTNVEVTIENSAGNLNLDNFTIEGWIYPYVSMINPGSFYNHKTIFDNIRCGVEGSQDGGGFALQITDMGELRLSMARPEPVGSETWVYITSDDIIQPHQWYHVAGTYDGSTMRMYINGVLVKELSYTLGYRPSDITARIGSEYMLNGRVRNWFTGKIDEVKLYNHALDAQDIKSSFEALKPDSATPFEINFGMKNTYANPGDTVCMPVYITNFKDFSISACQLSLNYDTTKLTFDSAHKDSGIINQWPLFSAVQSGSSLNIAMAGTTTPIDYGEGELFRCFFIVNPKASQDDTLAIHFSDINIDEKYNLITATGKDGRIYIQQNHIMYGDVTGNDEVNIFDAQKVLGYVVGSVQLPDSTCSNFTSAVADVSGNGFITSYDAALIFQHSVGLLPEFPVECNVPASLAKCSFVQESHLSISVQTHSDQIDYNLVGSNLKGFCAGEFSIQYDPSVDISNGSIDTKVRGATLNSKVDVNQDFLKIALVTNDDIDDNNPVTLISISLPASAKTDANAFAIKTALINEGKILTNFDNSQLSTSGRIQISPQVSYPSIRYANKTFVIYQTGNTPIDFKVWSLNGKLIANRNYTAGNGFKNITFNSPKGIYLYRLKTGKDLLTGKIMVSK